MNTTYPITSTRTLSVVRGGNDVSDDVTLLQHIMCLLLKYSWLKSKTTYVWRGMSSNELERKCAWELVVVVSTAAAYNREARNTQNCMDFSLEEERMNQRERVMVWEKGEQRKGKIENAMWLL